jgi:orotate phosphoribosyltransferase
MRSDNEARKLKAEIVAGFFRHGVALVNTKQPFRLASGAFSPIYLDHRRLFSVPSLRETVVSLWSEVVRSYIGNSDFKGKNLVIAGTATAGIAPAYALASKLNAGFVYVRSKPKEHGLGRMVEGVWSASDACIVVDDMVTTGGSLLEAASRIREEGGTVLIGTSVTRHDFPTTAGRFALEGLPLLSCLTSREIFTVAGQENLISEGDLASVLLWLDALPG